MTKQTKNTTDNPLKLADIPNSTIRCPADLSTKAIDYLSAFGNSLCSGLDSAKLADTSLTEINRLLQADLAVVYLRGSDDVLKPIAINGNKAVFSEITNAHHKLGQCLCGLAASGKIAYANNIHQDVRCTHTECKEAGILSVAALPLRHGEDTIGVLGLAFVEEQDLAASHTLMEAMADLLAMGLYNTILFENIERYAREQEEHIRMLAMNAEINDILTMSTGEVSEALQNCCEVLVKTLQAAFVRIWMLDDDSDYLALQASAGMYTSLNGKYSRKKKINDNKISKIFQTKKLIVSNDIVGDSLIIDQDWVRREGMKAFAGMPLFVGDKVVGVLGTFSKKSFSEMNIRGLRAASNTISLWIEQKNAWKSLQKQTRLLEVIFDGVPDALVLADKERQIQLCNQGFVTMFGYETNEIIGRQTRILYADETEFEQQGQLRFNPAAREDITPYEINFKRRDGSIFPTETVGTIVKTAAQNQLDGRQEDNVIGYLTLIRDVSRRKEAEKYKHHVQKMEALGTLSGGIAHDFNNLLNVIGGFTDLTLLDSEEGTQQHKNLLEVRNAARRAAELVKQILSFSRGMDEELRPMTIQHLAKEAAKMLASTLPSTIKVRQKIEPCGMVMADASRMHQVIMNLCTNAFHAMRESGGILEISLSQVQIDTPSIAGPSPGAYVLLTVSDSGCGIPVFLQERIFEPYFTTKTQDEGTGLGLATVHGIVQAHGGTITVESKVGTGSIFNIYLPLLEQQTALEDDDVDDDVDFMHSLPKIDARVLMVDDVSFNVDLGVQLLERAGCTVHGMTNSRAALALFRAEPNNFDLVLTDQTMPKLTGFEMAREMLKLRSDLPIIIVSGHSDLVNEEVALNMGICAFLEKPLQMEDLLNTVAAVTSSSGKTHPVVRRSSSAVGPAVQPRPDAGEEDITETARQHLRAKYNLADEQIKTMLAEVGRSMPQLITTATENNRQHAWKSLGEAAHTIKGQLLTLGLDELAELARTIELAAKSGEDADYSTELRQLSSAFAKWELPE